MGVSDRIKGLLVRKSNLNIIYCICIEVRIQMVPETHQIQDYGPEHLELKILMPSGSWNLSSQREVVWILVNKYTSMP